MDKALVFEAGRDGYSIEQLRGCMTVGELKSILEDYDDDMLFILSHDQGYTFGSISTSEMNEWEKYGDEWECIE